ncbi:MAG TPA: hypothetical protein VMT47_02040 [Polyangia bacterium]|jgi:hypothetical protein|nr:hypothetical protein [Polyangia bacterium]
MKPPVVEPLSPDVEALLASERDVVPQPDDFRRRAFLRARAALSKSASSPHAAAQPVFSWKWHWAAAVASVLVAGTLATAAIKARLWAAAAEPTLRGAPGAAPAARLPLPPSIDEPAPAATAPAPRPVVAPPRTLTRAEGYALELKVLQPARAAVARADVTAALAAIAEHERRFPNGQLTEEREALRVLALASAHRSEDARRAAATFRKRFPRSMLLARMNDALGERP